MRRISLGPEALLAQRLESSTLPAATAAAPQSDQPLRYRPDIDGLRAVAALSVLASHLGLLPAGFIGVDIFFVISGFLISGIIFRALQRRTFSFLDFYVRRVCRIFPAMLLVLICVSAASWLIFLPHEYRLIAQDVTASAGFAMNFWRHLYPYPEFDNQLTIHVHTLDHFWSLGVEEQFYLLWPLVAVAAWRVRTGVWALLGAITVVSFILCVSSNSFTAAYVLPWNRLWELSIGGALALVELDPAGAPGYRVASAFAAAHPLLTRRLGQAMSWVGGALLLVPLAALNPYNFTGWSVLSPVLGTTLLIAGGPKNFLNRRVLSAAPMLRIGQISYPIYLWHLPLLRIPPLLETGYVSAFFAKASAVTATFIVSYATFRWVELPIRGSRNKTPLALALCLALIAVASVGFLASTDRITGRLASGAVDRLSRAQVEDWLPGTRGIAWTLYPNQLITLGNESKRVLFIGDSSVQQYYPRVATILAEHPLNGHGVVFAAQEGCVPEIIERWDPLESTCRHASLSIL